MSYLLFYLSLSLRWPTDNLSCRHCCLQAVANVLHTFTSPSIITAEDLPDLISFNPTLGHPLVVSLVSLAMATHASPHGAHAYLDVLKRLPPTLPSFDILGRLLRDPTPAADPITHGRTTVADLVRSEVLGSFILNSIGWVERAQEEERQGLISDDRAAKGIQNVKIIYLPNFHVTLVLTEGWVVSLVMPILQLAHQTRHHRPGVRCRFY